MAECVSCGEPITDTAYVCHREAVRLGGRLRDAATLWPDLQDEVVRMVRHGDPTPRAGRPAPPEPIRPDGGAMRHYADQQPGWGSGLPHNEAASDVTWAVVNTMTTWARAIADATGADLPGDPDDLMRWVAGRLDWVRYEQWALEAFDELDNVRALMVRTVDRPPPRRYLGPCECTADLYVRGNPDIVTCASCDTPWRVADRLAWLEEQVHTRSFAAAEIEEAYGIRSDRIRQWASRGRIAQRGTDLRGRPLYALPEVLALARRVAAA